MTNLLFIKYHYFIKKAASIKAAFFIFSINLALSHLSVTNDDKTDCKQYS